MSIEQQLEHIGITLEQARNNVERWKALQRLYENADFELVFMDGYLVHEAARSVRAMAEPQLQEEKHQRMLKNNLRGVGAFQQYLKSVRQFGLMAENAIVEGEAAREELLAEQIGGGGPDQLNGAGQANRQVVYEEDLEDDSPMSSYTA